MIRKQKTLLVIMLILLFLPVATAFSVSPVKHEVTGNDPQSFTFTLKDVDVDAVRVSFEGELAEYAQVNSVQKNSENEGTITIRVNPPELSEGPHTVTVIFLAQASSGQVGVATELAPIIQYRVPYTGAHVNYTLGIQDERNPLRATLMLRNLGVEATTVTPTFAIGGQTFTNDPVLLGAGATHRSTYELPEIVYDPGVYQLTMQLASSQGVQEVSRSVLLGTPQFTLSNVRVEGDPGEIVSIKATIRTRWNEELNAIITPHITRDGQEWNLQPLETTLDRENSLEFFWESTNATYAKYELTLEIAALGLQEEMTTTLSWTEETSTPPRTNKMVILLILLFILFSATTYLLFKNK